MSETVCRCSLSPRERVGVRGKATPAFLAVGLAAVTQDGEERLRAACAFRPPALAEVAASRFVVVLQPSAEAKISVEKVNFGEAACMRRPYCGSQ